MFKYIGVMSMGLVKKIGNVDFGYNEESHIAKLKALKAAKPKLYWIGIGKADFLYESAVDLRKQYDEIGLNYVYRESEGNHVWNEWRLYFSELVPLFFK